jgi:hypothetical protein
MSLRFRIDTAKHVNPHTHKIDEKLCGAVAGVTYTPGISGSSCTKIPVTIKEKPIIPTNALPLIG